MVIIGSCFIGVLSTVDDYFRWRWPWLKPATTYATWTVAQSISVMVAFVSFLFVTHFLVKCGHYILAKWKLQGILLIIGTLMFLVSKTISFWLAA